MSVSTDPPVAKRTLAAKNDVRAVVFNLPNNLTWMRLIVTVVMFVTIAYEWYLTSLVLFVVAAATDWLDGYFARKYQLITTLGRILDPFADKVIICGTFIYLAAIPHSGVQSWMAVVIVGRELLVTALRSFIEQQGSDFSAKLSGKLKMVLQCAAAVLSLYYLYAVAQQSNPQWLKVALITSIWATLVLTVVSGAVYVIAAIKMVRESH